MIPALADASRGPVSQLEFYLFDTGYRADNGAETLLNRSETAGSAAASALLTDDGARDGHDPVAHLYGKRIRGKVGRAHQGRFDPYLERKVRRTLGGG